MGANSEGQVRPDQGEPYLSVVATARNDNHGGDLLGRMQIFVNAWIAQCKRHNLSSELILVEWNPPSDKPRLADALDWPGDTGPCAVRIIEVPPELHRRYRHAEVLPLYQMIAKNAGIRRARGEFILATNIDIVFNDDLVRFLASRALQKGRIYRIDRCDVTSNVPVDGTLDEQLAYCQSHVIRLCAREEVFTLTPDGLRENAAEDITRPGSGIHFGSGWFKIDRYTTENFRWIAGDAEVFLRVPAGGGVLALEVEPGPGVGVPPQPLQALDRNGTPIAEWVVSGRTTLRLGVPEPGNNGWQAIRLHAPTGGLPVTHDPRILNFRFFRCDWIDADSGREEIQPLLRTVRASRITLARLGVALWRREGLFGLMLKGPGVLWRALRLLRMRGADIFDAGAEFLIGNDWQILEYDGGERFRWAAWNVELVVRINEGNKSLGLVIEPGPNLGFRPFHLVIRLGSGEIIGKRLVKGLTYMEVPLPIEEGAMTSLFLSPEGGTLNGGVPLPGDARTLNFRVFACGRGVANAPSAAHSAPSGAGSWTSRTVGTRPPAVDWQVELKDHQRAIAEMGKPEFLHINACGDFTLMAREHWYDVRSYAELDQFSMHLDSMLCHAVHQLGVQEEVLSDPMRIYHIEHGTGSGWTPEGKDQLFDRIGRMGIQSITFADLVAMIAQMRHVRAPLVFNMEDWGLAEFDLPETDPSRLTPAEAHH